MDTVVVPLKLENEYGSGYGTLYLIFAERPVHAEAWIHTHLEADGKPYWQDRSLYDQVVVEIITYYDRQGNASRSAWWHLLQAFARGGGRAGDARENCQAKPVGAAGSTPTQP